jgi:F-type H+-transporting ATPase subunit delta
MTLSAVTTRYAHALADVVTASGSPLPAADAVVQLKSFETALRSSLELQHALTTPSIPVGRKRAVVGKIAGVLRLSQIARNFLFVLVDHRRIASLTQIIHTFELVVDERLGFARAEVITAARLNEEQETALRIALERISGKRLSARYAVDGSLIGGVVARIGSTVYDGSVRGQLDILEHLMRAKG